MSARASSQIVCDVGALAPDAVAVDTLSRLQLEAQRLGVEIRLRNVSPELAELLDLAGLRDVLRVETSGQAEEREERLGVEEERELDDPAR
jgi:anti-anti-sigma regulatory factor